MRPVDIDQELATDGVRITEQSIVEQLAGILKLDRLASDVDGERGPIQVRGIGGSRLGGMKVLGKAEISANFAPRGNILRHVLFNAAEEGL